MRNFLKKLDRRLISLICITVIPINLLAILFSGLAAREAQKRVLYSQEREFESLTSQETQKIHELEERYDTLFKREVGRLTSAQQFNAVYSISAVNHLGGEMYEIGLHGFTFVRERQGEKKLYVKGQVSLEESNSLKMELRAMEVSSGGLQMLLGKYYYCKTFAFRNYTMGFCVNATKEMQLLDTSVLTGSQFLLCDGSVQVLADADGIKSADNAFKDANVLATASVGALTVKLLRPHNDMGLTAPLIALQALAWSSLLLLVLLWLVIRRQVVTPLRVLQLGMERLEQDEDYRIREDAFTEDFSYLYSAFNKMAEDIQASHEKDVMLYKAEFDNLRLQVNPHMILNSLTTIYSMVETKRYSLIQRFTMNLVEYFRYSLRENREFVQIEAELNFVKNYMELQKIRYPDELASNYFVSEGLEEAMIPPLLIENFVENAVKYARIPDQTIEILIWIHREDDFLCIEITDTGKGMEPEILELLNHGEPYIDQNGLRHIGVWNCRRRLRCFFGDRAELCIESQRTMGTTVNIRMPVQF